MKRVDWVLAGTIVLLAAWLRFEHLRFMEFKEDEAGGILLALSVPTSGFEGLPTYGPISSVGVYYPPLYVYILLVPMICSRDPLFITGFIALLNIGAVFLCYVGTLRLYGRSAAVAASALMATLPAAILFSRKTWNPNLLPVLGMGLTLSMLGFLRIPGFWNQFCIAALAGLIWQINFFGLFILPVVGGALVARWRRLQAKALGLGLCVALLPLIPYGLFLARARLEPVKTALSLLRGQAGSKELMATRLARAYRAPGLLASSAFLSTDYHYTASGVGKPAHCVLQMMWVVLPASVLYLLLRCMAAEDRGLALLLLVPPFLWALTGLATHTHYFLAFLPAICIALGRVSSLLADVRGCGKEATVSDRQWPRGRLLCTIVSDCLLAAILLGNFFLWKQFLGEVVAHGGLAGGYGTAYTYKAQAAAYFAERQEAIREFRTLCPPGKEMPFEMQCLVYLQGLRPRSRQAAVGTYEFLDTLRSRDCPYPDRAPIREFGPLRVYFQSPHPTERGARD